MGMHKSALSAIVMACFLLGRISGFLPSQVVVFSTPRWHSNNNIIMPTRSRLSMIDSDKGPLMDDVNEDIEEKSPDDGKAATRTVNERLLQELEDAAKKEKFGARSNMGKKMGLESFQSTKTDEERRAGIEEARNLNGVNPLVAIAGSAFALTAAGGLWYLTSFLGGFFATHVPQTDVYFVQRVTGVFRNVVVGLSALASGFFGVTGLGIGLLGARVAIGVAKGELDSTPLKKNQQNDLEVPNVWDLMTNKKPGRRGRKK